eukprot:3668522-Pyramimonas_sp.AAC.1
MRRRHERIKGQRAKGIYTSVAAMARQLACQLQQSQPAQPCTAPLGSSPRCRVALSTYPICGGRRLDHIVMSHRAIVVCPFR